MYPRTFMTTKITRLKKPGSALGREGDHTQSSKKRLEDKENEQKYYRDRRELHRKQTKNATTLDELKRLLVFRYGNLVKAWNAFDDNANGYVSFTEFCSASRAVGYSGDLKEAFGEMDVDGSLFISMAEFCPKESAILNKFKGLVIEKYGSLADAFTAFDTNKSNMLTLNQFREGCKSLGRNTGLNADTLFFWLDADNTGVVTLEEIDPDAAQASIRDQLSRQFLLDESNFRLSEGRLNLLTDDLEKAVTAVQKSKQTARQEYRKIIEKAREIALEKDKNAKTLPAFRVLLKNRFGSFVNAWRLGMDYDGNGRISYQEFCKACREIGYFANVRSLFNELDQNSSGFISLYDLDFKSAVLVEDLCHRIGENLGNPEAAWNHFFNAYGSNQCWWPVFQMCCEAINFPKEKARLVFSAIDTDCSHYLTVDEFRFLDIWFEDRPEGEVSERYKGFRKATTKSTKSRFERCPPKNTNVQKRLHSIKSVIASESIHSIAENFVKLLKRRYGSILGAWRLCMDRDKNGRISFVEFCRACRDMGFVTNIQRLFDFYDPDQSGHISLMELDPATAQALNEFASACQWAGDFATMWSLCDPLALGHVNKTNFVKACNAIRYPDGDKIFHILDTDKSNLLQKNEVEWILEEEKTEKETYEMLGPICLFGKSKAQTTCGLNRNTEQVRERKHRVAVIEKLAEKVPNCSILHKDLAARKRPYSSMLHRDLSAREGISLMPKTIGDWRRTRPPTTPEDEKKKKLKATPFLRPTTPEVDGWRKTDAKGNLFYDYEPPKSLAAEITGTANLLANVSKFASKIKKSVDLPGI